MNTYHPPRILYLVILTVLTFTLWASLFEIDQTVRTQGQFIPDAHTQILQAVDGGVLSEIRVQEGDTVKAGQVVAILEPDRARAASDESHAKVAAIQIALTRAKAEATGQSLKFGKEFKDYPDLVSAQRQLYQQHKQGLEDTLKVLRESLALANDELAMNEALFKTGDTSRLELLRARRQSAELKARMNDVTNKYLQDARTEVAKQEEELSSQRYRQAERDNVLSHTAMTSPVDGVVKYLRVNTVGGVLRGGDEIMQISPTEGELLLEVRINPRDIGLLRLGLPVALRLDAFDYTLYGSLAGELIYLSSDTLTEQGSNNQAQVYYRGRIRLEREALSHNPKLQGVSLKPGMTATVDIRTGQRTVLAYLMKPIARAFGGAMNER